jgi:hypothetical protein
MVRHDQYGNDVDTANLVLLPRFADLDEDDRKIVERATWYELDRRVLVADYTELFSPVPDEFMLARPVQVCLSEDDPIDAGIDIKTCRIDKVDDVLKRGNEVDGFYHA